MGKNFKGGSKHKKYARNRFGVSKTKLSDLSIIFLKFVDRYHYL